MLFKLWNNNK